MQDVFNYYGEDLNRVEEHMQMCLRSEVRLIHEIVDHIIGSGGKRFRPLMLLASSGLCGYTGERRFPMSVVIEFVHTATLLHDDVIDHAKIRRGKTSANNIWGNAASVLVGDFLYSTAFKLMTADGNLDIMRLISAATNSMSEGEVFQLVKCGDIDITEDEYLLIIQKKTSFLISAACTVGGILGGAGETDIKALTDFGMKIGSAFQITDDTLDYLANEEEFGKSVGQDLQEGKITLPLIHTLGKCSPAERKLIKKAIGRKTLSSETIAGVTFLIRKYGGAGYALDKARQYIEGGKEFLRHFGDSEDKTALLTISDYILERRL